MTLESLIVSWNNFVKDIYHLPQQIFIIKGKILKGNWYSKLTSDRLKTDLRHGFLVSLQSWKWHNYLPLKTLSDVVVSVNVLDQCIQPAAGFWVVSHSIKCCHLLSSKQAGETCQHHSSRGNETSFFVHTWWVWSHS